MINLVRPGHLTMMQLMERMTSGPARLYSFTDQGTQDVRLFNADCKDASLPKPYGIISEGTAADLVIFNPEETFIAGNYQSKSENTPFTGMELYGKIKYTICKGEIVWNSITE